MLTLGGESLRFANIDDERAFLVRLTENDRLPMALRSKHGVSGKGPTITAATPEGFRVYVCGGRRERRPRTRIHWYQRSSCRTHTAISSDGDVLRIAPHRRGVRVLYRRKARPNGILADRTAAIITA